MSEKKSSLLRFRLKKILDTLASKEGRHTELISLYINPGKQISDVMNSLRSEYSTASNIKSRTTRKNVLDAIEKVMQRLRLFREAPPNGLVIFCGAIPHNGVGSEKMEIYAIEPPEPTPIYYYRCDQRFHLEYLMDMLKETSTYGIIVIDGSDATVATLRGMTLKTVREFTSGIPGKHRAGGQSAKRFEKLREAEVNLYMSRIGNHINEIFLPIPDLKGIIVGGPGPTKYDFVDGDYLQYTLKDKMLSTVDTAYTGKSGLDEVVEKSPDILKEVRYVEEKKLMQSFLYELGHESGLVTYGENEVRNALYKGIVRILLISETFEEDKVTVQCSNCDYAEQVTIKGKESEAIEAEYAGKTCPKCSMPNLKVNEIKDVIDEMAEVAEQTGTEVEIISTQNEEGVELKESFGGVAAILRYKQQ
ncbi:MAG: peptide chain release factor aRF-1 [Candidatus Bathyarchaeota archaeon]